MDRELVARGCTLLVSINFEGFGIEGSMMMGGVR